MSTRFTIVSSRCSLFLAEQRIVGGSKRGAKRALRRTSSRAERHAARQELRAVAIEPAPRTVCSCGCGGILADMSSDVNADYADRKARGLLLAAPYAVR